MKSTIQEPDRNTYTQPLYSIKHCLNTWNIPKALPSPAEKRDGNSRSSGRDSRQSALWSGEVPLPLTQVAAPLFPLDPHRVVLVHIPALLQKNPTELLQRGERGGEKNVRNCRKGRENICLETGGGNKASFLQACNVSINDFKHSHTK